ncbi:hypothetical protein PoB_004148100 [Plakobranchus ocellatus]|uniref:Uncharacterized protein n=1 Tax=Plakobranchus ocellatus TaxID=259542 RepID=A0AAV4B3E0_9GAST|nr:hypothetical protein PoB_004148100 [Plakobranchus ocellatus]
MNNKFDSDDDVLPADLLPLVDIMPLTGMPRNMETNLEVVKNDGEDNESMISEYLDDSDNDPGYVPGIYPLNGCKSEDREKVFKEYYKLSELRLQREYIVRHQASTQEDIHNTPRQNAYILPNNLGSAIMYVKSYF